MALVTTELSPTSLLMTLPGWDNLSRKDQIFIEKETRALGDSLADYGRSRLSIGERLSNVQSRMGRGMFAKYLKAYHFKRSTAYATIKAFNNAVQNLPEAVLKIAMARNMPILGESDEAPLGSYSKAARRLPPPDSKDPIVINQYLDSLESAKTKDDGRSKRMKEIDADPEETAKKCYRAIVSFIRRLPSTGDNRKDKRDQISFAENVFGMVFADLGMSSAKLIEPQAAPQGYQAVVGRPSKEQAA